MSMKLTIFIFFLSTLSLSSYSIEHIAKVTKLRGEVTQLIPGSYKARLLKIGDTVIEDTSLVTRARSFVRIEFLDGSSSSLGPNSKLIISKMNRSGKGILTLLKGQLRSKINGSNTSSKGHKFLVKTRSAALGVRGTEFQTIYNPDNHITNLLTFKGEVSMAKLDSEDSRYVSEIDKISNRQLSETKRLQLKNELKGEMERSLASNRSVNVKRGQFSMTIDSMDSATLPVRINPVQLNALYANNELSQAEKSSSKLYNANTFEKTRDFISPVAQEVSTEGVYDSNKSKYAQKSGGFIDTKSAIYIPPEKTAIFSQSKNMYIARKVGSFESNTGEYSAPKGLRLDPGKGFVVMNSSQLGSEVKNKKKNQAAILNNIIDKKLVLKKRPRADRSKFYNQLELFSKNSISIKVEHFNQTIKHFDSPQTPGQDIKGDGNGFTLSWNHSSGGKWQPITNFSYKSIRFDDAELGIFKQGSSSLYGMEIGMRRYINSRLNLSSKVALNQNFFTASSSANSVTSYDLRKATVPSLDFVAQWFFIKSKRYDFDLKLGLMGSLNKTAKDISYKSGLGAKVALGYRYWFSKEFWTRIDYSYLSDDHDISGTNYSATNSLTHSGLGLELGYSL